MFKIIKRRSVILHVKDIISEILQKGLYLHKKHVNWIEEEWNNVLCIDESKFEIFGSNLRVSITVEKD